MRPYDWCHRDCPDPCTCEEKTRAASEDLAAWDRAQPGTPQERLLRSVTGAVADLLALPSLFRSADEAIRKFGRRAP